MEVANEGHRNCNVYMCWNLNQSVGGRMERWQKMSREILFKAKGTETGIWRYGYLIPLPNIHRELHIFDDTTQDWYEVDPSTVCQYTGLTDRNGVKVWEGDIFDISSRIGIVKYGAYQAVTGCESYHMGFYVEWQTLSGVLRNDLGYWALGAKICGNMFDNPELLEGRNGRR